MESDREEEAGKIDMDLSQKPQEFVPSEEPQKSTEAQDPQKKEAAKFRFFIRSEEGGTEFGVIDFAQLQHLYHSGFLTPESFVRRADSQIWRRAGAMPELETVKPLHWFEGNEFAILAGVICVATVLLIFIVDAIR